MYFLRQLTVSSFSYWRSYVVRPLLLAGILSMGAGLCLPTTSYAESIYRAAPIEQSQPAPALSTPLLLDTQPVTLPDSLYTPLLKTDTLTVDLASILQRVQTDNLYIQLQDTQRQVAQANFATKLIDPLPNVNAVYSRNKFDGVIQLFGNQTLPVEQTIIEPTIRYDQTLELGGKQIWDSLQARQDYKAAKAQLKATTQQQLAAATKEFYDWHEAYYLYDVRQSGLTAANELLRKNEARFDGGVGTKLEVMQALAQQAERAQQRFLALKQLATAEEILLNRLNLPVNVRLQPTQLANQKHAGVQATGSPAWVQTVINQHPDMERLEREVDALRWQSRSVLSTIAPQLNLSAYTGYRGPTHDQLQRITGAGFTLQTTVGNKLGLLMPTAYVGARKLTASKKTEREAKHRELESLILQALLESRRADATVTAAQAQEGAAKEAYRLANARQKAGVGTQLDVLDASDRWQQAQGASVTALMDYNRAQIQLLEALGKAEPDTLLYGAHVNAAGQLAPNVPAAATPLPTKDATP